MQRPAWLPMHTNLTLCGTAVDIGGADNSNVALLRGPDAGGEDDFEEKAAFIVRAANTHHTLVAALKFFANEIGIGSDPDYRPTIRLPREAILAARTAIAEAAGGCVALTHVAPVEA